MINITGFSDKVKQKENGFSVKVCENMHDITEVVGGPAGCATGGRVLCVETHYPVDFLQ